MAYDNKLGNNVEGLELKGIINLNRKELGRGAYGRVFEVKYCETICAAKEIHSVLIDRVGSVEMQRIIESFMRECLQCSKLRHPNIIQFLGFYYPTEASGNNTNRMRLPVMVMEKMAFSLTTFVERESKEIPIHIKYSIVHDVSLGLCYLHNHDPPIVHRDLSPNNILLTAHHVAKISDLGVAKVINAHSTKRMTAVPGSVDFMPPETFSASPFYGPPMDVFSFAGVILHTFSQQWPTPSEVEFYPKAKMRVHFSEIKRRQKYLDEMIGEAEVLRPLVEECLDDDPTARPTIATVCKRIQTSKDAYMKKSPQDVITLLQQLELLWEENEQIKNENKQLRNVNEEQCAMITAQSAAINQFTTQLTCQLNRVTLEETSTTKLRMEAPLLIPALTSGRYHIKWTRLADSPVPLFNSYVAIKNHKIYVTGSSPDVDAKHTIYTYNIMTNQWDQLPLSGHCLGVPHIIGEKLVIIGGGISGTKARTNKVSTFDEKSRIWTSYYPDLISIRSRPGVVSHLEYVIVAGGRLDEETIQNDIEVLNWMENSHWRKVSINLPVPMYDFTPSISNDYLLIVGHWGKDRKPHRNVYKIPVANITASIDRQHNCDTFSGWTELTPVTHLCTASVPSSSPSIVVGGWTQTSRAAEDIDIYDNSNRSWRTVGSLSSGKCLAGVAAAYNNAIIIIGGCTIADTKDSRKSSSLKVTELGQAELLL